MVLTLLLSYQKFSPKLEAAFRKSHRVARFAEQDHKAIKRIVKPMLECKSFNSARNTHINKKSKGSTFQEISLGELRKIIIMVASLAEQQKITACLSSLDELITAKIPKIEALKTHKKSLMQHFSPLLIC